MCTSRGLTFIDQHSPTGVQVKYWNQALLSFLPREALISLGWFDAGTGAND